jgi:hypothetical protein
MKITATRQLRHNPAWLRKPALVAVLVSSAGFSPAPTSPAQSGFVGTLRPVTDLRAVSVTEPSRLGRSVVPHSSEWSQQAGQLAVQTALPAYSLAHGNKDYRAHSDLTSTNGLVSGNTGASLAVSVATVAKPSRQLRLSEAPVEDAPELLSSVATWSSADLAGIDGSPQTDRAASSLAALDAGPIGSVSDNEKSPRPASVPEGGAQPRMPTAQFADAVPALESSSVGPRVQDQLTTAPSTVEPASLVQASTEKSLPPPLPPAEPTESRPKLIDVNFALTPVAATPYRLSNIRAPATTRAEASPSSRKRADARSSRYRLTGRGVEFTIPVVLDGQMQGSVAMLVSQSQIAEVRLRDLLSIVAPMLAPEEAERLGNAQALSEYVSLRQLREAGIDFRYDAGLDRLNLLTN